MSEKKILHFFNYPLKFLNPPTTHSNQRSSNAWIHIKSKSKVVNSDIHPQLSSLFSWRASTIKCISKYDRDGSQWPWSGEYRRWFLQATIFRVPLNYLGPVMVKPGFLKSLKTLKEWRPLILTNRDSCYEWSYLQARNIPYSRLASVQGHLRSRYTCNLLDFCMCCLACTVQKDTHNPDCRTASHLHHKLLSSSRLHTSTRTGMHSQLPREEEHMW